jgi:multidrug efflux system membrane fusion protein
MRGTYITASIIALLIVLWLVSGQIGNDADMKHSSLAEANRERAAKAQDTAPARVRARVIHATPQVQRVVLRGRTENKRTVEVKAETAGRIVERPVERGTAVEQGDLLCRISIEDRLVGLEEGRAALEQARIEHQASLRLQEKGYQSETAIAQAKARLAAAEAQVARRELDIERTYVRAPFAGVVEDVHLEVGDYVSSAGSCATVVEMNPMLLVGRVSERQVSELEIGQTVTGALRDGRSVEGALTFVGQQADTNTRTYPVEVEVPNPDYNLRSGITTEILIPVGEVLAHKISPAVFSLDDEGNIGVRTVNDQRRVEYHRINIVRDDGDGVWVTGLPEVTTLITVGQELVVPGQEVELSFEPAAEMPAKVDVDRPPASSRVGGSGRGETGLAKSTATVAAKP